jgi:hypothetical protein
LFLAVITITVMTSGCIEWLCGREWTLMFEAPTFTDEECRDMCYKMHKTEDYRVERNAVAAAGGVYLDRCYCNAIKCND